MRDVAENEMLAEEFEAHRGHLRAVAYRMLGSVSEADDAVQEAWLRLNRVGGDDVHNLGGWLTTVVGRVCVDMLRSRTARREQSWEERLPDPVIGPPEGGDPEQEALLSDAVGLALLIVLDSLGPNERLSFVLHDMFGVPFEDIAPIVGRSPAAARQLASRARRRVQGNAPVASPDAARQRRVVEAFMAAARGGDFEALVEVLHPDVLLRVDVGGGGLQHIRGAEAVAGRALSFRRYAGDARMALVNGVLGLVSMPQGRAFAVMGLTVEDDRISGIDILADPERLANLDLSALS